MKFHKNEDLVKINRTNTVRLSAPKKFRRLDRAKKNRAIRLRNDGQPVGGGMHTIGFNVWGASAVFTPTRRKMKGWQRENRRYKKVA